MCGRFASTSSPDELASYFDAVAPAEAAMEPNHNVAPTTDIAVIHEEGDERLLAAMHWGLVPSWAKDPSIGNRMINARAEGITDKPSYRVAFRKRRSIIPVDGFYEWRKIPGSRSKQPYFIHRPDGEPFAFAGLWERWRGPNRDGSQDLRSATIITTTPNEPMAAIHDRMPVILPPTAWDVWLDPSVDDVDLLASLLIPAPPEIIAMHPVSTDVGNVRNRGPHLMEPIELDETLFG